MRIISYDRILAFDEIGDSYNDGPHLLVEYSSDGQPFDIGLRKLVLESAPGNSNQDLDQREAKRISYFTPEVIRLTLPPKTVAS